MLCLTPASVASKFPANKWPFDDARVCESVRGGGSWTFILTISSLWAVAELGDTLDEHAYDTISGGDWLTDQDAVEAFVKEAPQELLRLEHWGCPWSREPDGHVAVRAFGGMKKMRTWFAADKTGFH